MTNKEKAKAGIWLLKQAIQSERDEDTEPSKISKISEDLDIKVPRNEHGIQPNYLTWSIVCMLEEEG